MVGWISGRVQLPFENDDNGTKRERDLLLALVGEFPQYGDYCSRLSLQELSFAKSFS